MARGQGRDRPGDRRAGLRRVQALSDPPPTEVVLDVVEGMPEDCALSLDNVTLVPKELFRTPITRLSIERMNEVCRALALASGCA